MEKCHVIQWLLMNRELIPNKIINDITGAILTIGISR